MAAVGPPGVVDIVPAARTALIRCDRGAGPRRPAVALPRGARRARRAPGARLASTDTLSGIGPPAPAAGDRYGVDGLAVEPIVVDVAPPRPIAHEARISPGPRVDWFAAGALSEMVATTWTIALASRVGVRLRGVPLRRVVTDELPSEGLVRGAVQVPPDGDPVMMLADHPTTGGYPVVAVVHPDDVAIVAQHHEGTRVRFRV